LKPKQRIGAGPINSTRRLTVYIGLQAIPFKVSPVLRRESRFLPDLRADWADYVVDRRKTMYGRNIGNPRKTGNPVRRAATPAPLALQPF